MNRSINDCAKRGVCASQTSRWVFFFGVGLASESEKKKLSRDERGEFEACMGGFSFWVEPTLSARLFVMYNQLFQ